MSDLDVVQALAVEWALWTREDGFPWTGDHCINGTRVCIDVLSQLGVEAAPESIGFVLFNQFAYDLWRAGVPMIEWPSHAHSLGVQPGMVQTVRGQWNGHLVVDGGDWWFDPSSQQFHRPGRINVPVPFVFPVPLPPLGTQDEMRLNHGLVLLVHRWPENNAWRTASGWTRKQISERNLLCGGR